MRQAGRLCSASCRSEHLLHEIPALEEGQIAELFAGADEACGDREFPSFRDSIAERTCRRDSIAAPRRQRTT